MSSHGLPQESPSNIIEELDLGRAKDSEPSTQLVGIGSDSWLGADIYQPDGELRAQVVKFFNSVKWDVLASVASKRREGLRCKYTEKFSIGHFNMVRRLIFDDGVSWVARVRLPADASHANLELYDDQRAFEVELASMLYFKSKTSVPVPEVFAYNMDCSNEVGARYMLMEYIHGTTASELRRIKSCKPSTYGTSEQDRKFREQMAKIQAEVLLCRFQKIGSLYYSKETSDFYIGPDVEMGKGPWTSSMDYYLDLADHLIKKTAARFGEETKQSPSFALPTLFNFLMSMLSEERTGPFRLINRDFGAHNILVNDDFDIVGVVDFDGVMAAPMEVVSQYPVLSCLEVEPPGHVETNPFAIEWIKQTEPQLARYKGLLMKYEAELGDGSAPVASRLGTTPAMLFQGMICYAICLWNENDKWWASGLKILGEYAKNNTADELQGSRTKATEMGETENLQCEK